MFAKAMFGAVLALYAGSVSAETIEVWMLNSGEAGVMVFEPSFVKAQPGDVIRFVPTDKGHNVESISGMLPEGVASKVQRAIRADRDARGALWRQVYAALCHGYGCPASGWPSLASS
nr:plastocyanin/azurin family copper-binding protein [Paracoccus rhizosphaerae]